MPGQAQQKKSKSFRVTKTQILVIIIIVLISLASALFVQSLNVQLYEQRAYSLGQTTEKIVQIINHVIDSEWDKLTYISHELQRDVASTRQQLLLRLADFYSIDAQENSWMVACIDSNGYTYRWDGQTVRWVYPYMLISSSPSQQITTVDSQGNSGEEQMAFLFTLPQNINLTTESNIVLTHTVLFLDMAEFGRSLEVSAFEGKSFSYITQQSGRPVYHQQNQNEFISAYNILSALEKATFLYGNSYADLSQSISSSSDLPYVAEIEYTIEDKKERYFVAYSLLSEYSWSLFLFVPEDNIGSNTADFVRVLLTEVAIIATLVIAAITVFVWTNSRQTLAKQQIAVAEAQRASQAKSDFLSQMSHDIRTPLNGIMGMCYIAEKRVGDTVAVKECLDKIDLSSRQLMALINDVLDMSRIEQDNTSIRHEAINLNELISMCAIHIEVSVNQKEISFTKNTDGIINPLVFGDTVIIDKIITNILGNAAKFTPAGGKIQLTASEKVLTAQQSIYQFEISDSGIGMKPEFLAHIFEPFSQEDTGSRTQYQGTGLGLSIVKKLVDKLGGDIAVQSTEGEGSTFTVTLPLERASQSDFAAKQNFQTFNGKGFNVLLVEDNELNSLIAKTILEDCGLTVDCQSNGEGAVTAFFNSEEGQYNLILMDVRMPIMDGLEASRRIRALSRKDAATVPIVALSANALAEDIEQTRQAGMNDHLGKPIDINKLYAILQQYCKQHEKDNDTEKTN